MKGFWTNAAAFALMVAVVGGVVGFICGCAALIALLDTFLPIGLVVVGYLVLFILGFAAVVTYVDNRKSN